MGKNTKKATEQEANTPALVAYHVPDRENAIWTRIRAAWSHKDGKGFSLQLDLVPAASGKIVLRNFEPKEQGEGA
jgi:hypothetical protein